MDNLTIQEIDVLDFKKLWDQTNKPVLIDVRETHEWEQAHIPDARLIPKGVIQQNITEIVPSKSTPIYLHCQAGVRSLSAGLYLVELGYQSVFSIKGGINEWAMYGFPIESGVNSALV